MKNWYKNAIIYRLDVESFYDANGDGIGDFQGLKQKLHYLAGLGIDCIWILPFYPTPNRDNGYDVKDYFNIDPRLGNLGDFVDFVHQAKAFGIKVIIDLVVNHTSIEHPWFQESRKSPDSPYRDYYIWVKEPKSEKKERVVFNGIEHSVWEYDEMADAYYLHHFFKEQPDLNIDNPTVQAEILKIMGFWLELGISGFRIDAAHILTETIEQVHEDKDNLHHILNIFRDFQKGRNAEAVLIGEANVEYDKLKEYFGQKDRLHLLFNFMVNKNMFLSLARKDASPLYKTYKEICNIEPAEWVNFIRHHDELNLEYLTEEERNEVFETFAPQEEMRIFGHGIRRRFPPMVNGDRKRIEMFYSLLFSLQGIPMISYGEELGMGDNLALSGRTSVRTPMQWSNAKNGGFSKAETNKLVCPLVTEGAFSYHKINVLQQMSEPDSLMHWMENLIRVRKKCPEIGNGNWKTLTTNNAQVFACEAEWQDQKLLCLHNFGEAKAEVKIKTPYLKNAQLVNIFGDRVYKTEDSQEVFSIEGYGYRWIKVFQKA
ncbi:alpha-amylase family protein [Cytophagaceae bacterium ABcell3]|nr:alpha-amylase family protein [Cytophagaceae bacterium ABcell3]